MDKVPKETYRYRGKLTLFYYKQKRRERQEGPKCGKLMDKK
jgi:hypothetical protein